MDRHDDDAFALSDSLEDLHHHEGVGGVEPRGRFVQEEDDGVVDDVDADGDAAPFDAGDAAVAFVADDGGGGGAEAELVDEGVDAGFFLGLGEGAGEAELGGETRRSGARVSDLGNSEHRLVDRAFNVAEVRCSNFYL
ncbi:uncharacterized protein LOC109788442 isoform X2 [Cajanus cajan]|uniref:uncharacterized protein LOC109788442 isoform X2 n=1 Tax=Cajanus cajan TaxID=3821 RepID=UPI0010FBA722|nr:uncharacterized protein LOC109788442 isoform X2 [Cajanus cajan]